MKLPDVKALLTRLEELDGIPMTGDESDDTHTVQKERQEAQMQKDAWAHNTAFGAQLYKAIPLEFESMKQAVRLGARNCFLTEAGSTAASFCGCLVY